MRLSEWLLLGFLAYLAISAAMTRVPAVRQRRIWVTAFSAALALVAAATAGVPGRIGMVRDWLPAIGLLVAYWLSGLSAARPSAELERRLAAIDALVSAPLRAAAAIRRVPLVVLEYLESTYLLCYALVPLGLGALYLAGRTESADRFWTVVLVAALPCYAILPWVATRPPRSLGPATIDDRPLVVRPVNLWILNHGSIGLNTFPSGHAAAALATALAVGRELPWVGLAFGAVAVSIAIASVAGRYHYLADAVLGLLLAAVAAALCWWGLGPAMRA